MAFFYNFVIITIPLSFYATFLAFRMGKDLPKACRNFGREIGMGYTYFKVVLKLIKPESEKPAEMLDILRKSD